MSERHHPSFHIERAGPSDAQAVKSLTREAYAAWADLIGREPLPMRADYARAVVDHHIDLLRVQGTLVALIEMIPKTDHLLVENLAVRPRYQGQGYGRALMAHAEQVARSAQLRAVQLYTNQRFERNIAFYLSLGYAIEWEQEMSPGIVAIHMSKHV